MITEISLCNLPTQITEDFLKIFYHFMSDFYCNNSTIYV